MWLVKYSTNMVLWLYQTQDLYTNMYGLVKMVIGIMEVNLGGILFTGLQNNYMKFQFFVK